MNDLHDSKVEADWLAAHTAYQNELRLSLRDKRLWAAQGRVALRSLVALIIFGFVCIGVGALLFNSRAVGVLIGLCCLPIVFIFSPGSLWTNVFRQQAEFAFDKSLIARKSTTCQVPPVYKLFS